MTQLATRLTAPIRRNLGDIIGARPDVTPATTPRVGSLGGNGVGLSPNQLQQFFHATRPPTDRVREMRYYDYLETEISDCRRALDAFATMAVTGNLAGGGDGTYHIQMVGDEEDYPDPLRKRLEWLETMISVHAYYVTRTMCKYGSFMPEIQIGRKPDGRLGVCGLRPIPPGTIFRNVGNDGAVDPARYWVQMIEGVVQGPGSAQQDRDSSGLYRSGIPQWRLPHFSLWSNVVTATETMLYGTSLLQPFGAIGLKVQATLDAAVVARLSRAAMRYIWHVDVTDIKDDQAAIQRRVKSWQTMVQRSEDLLNGATNTDSYQRTPVPDSDIFVPSAKSLSYDVGTLDGDSNLSRVGDIDLLVRFYFGALGLPPEYVGHERSQGGRSNLSQIDINFARMVRHIQMFGGSGWEHIIWVDMMLAGYDPREFPVRVVPPPIGARDDLLQAQIRVLQTQVIANLATAGLDITVKPRWVLETFLNMDEELNDLSPDEISALFKAMPEQSQNDPPATPDQQHKIWQRMMGMEGDLMDSLRMSFRAMAANSTGHLGPAPYNRDQPTPEMLASQLPNVS